MAKSQRPVVMDKLSSSACSGRVLSIVSQNPSVFQAQSVTYV
jgi:hypothetical protein